jgi:hypothetical protein
MTELESLIALDALVPKFTSGKEDANRRLYRGKFP